ncbi:MAG: hypothetical protein AABM66_10095 [Actinomycetota bacterium]
MEVSLEPGGEPSETLAFEVVPGTTDAVEFIYLSGADEALTGVQLFGRVGGRTVAVTPLGAAAPAAIDIPAGGVVPAELKVTDPDPGVSEGELNARVGAEVARVAGIEVHRAPGDVLSVAGATDTGVQFTAATSLEFSRPLIIESSANQAVDVAIAVDPFVGTASEQVVPEVDVQDQPLDPNRTYTIPANGRLDLTIRATLQAGGDYTSALSLVYEQKRTTVPLKVTRTRQALSVDVETPPAIDVAERLWGEPTTAEFEVTVRETGGRAVVLPAPTVSVTRTREQAQLGIVPDSITVDGGTPAPVELAADGQETFVVEVSGLPGPGQYAVEVSYPSSEGDPREATTQVFAKRGWWDAFLWFLAFAVISFFLRFAWTTWRDRLLAQRSVAVVAEKLEEIVAREGFTAHESPAVEKLRDALVELWQELERDAKADTAKRDAVAGKLPLFARWLAASKRAHETKAGDAVFRELDRVRDYLADSSVDEATAKQAMTRAEEGLARLPTIRQRVEQLEEILRDSQAAELDRAKTQEIENNLSEARARIDENKADDAEAAYKKALKGWLGAATSKLEQLAKEDAPGVSTGAKAGLAGKLAEAQGEINNADDPDGAWRAFEAAYRGYLEMLIEGLRGEAETRWGEDVAIRKQILAPLARAQDALTKRELRRARAEYSDAQRLYNADVEKMAPAGAKPEPGLGGGQPAAIAAPPTMDPPATARLRDAPAVLLPSAMLTKRLGRLEWVLSLLAAVPAALLGVFVLYDPSATWGTANDLVAAVLWSFGLHQAGAAVAATTVEGVLAKLRPTS